jgi:hypothetical protein
MVSMLTLSLVDRGFEPRSGQNKNCEIAICCFSAKQAALRRKSKDDDEVGFVLDQHAEIFLVLAHWNNSPRVDMSLHSDTLYW